MRENRPSATAQRVALRRAAHQLLDEPKVFEDPVALRIVGAESAAALQADPRHLERSPLDRYLRAFMVARSRCAEDELAQAIERGARQYVVLGAGLDTFAYRNPYPEAELRVFEVDHPATQAWKRERLGEAGISIPRALTFAPVNFENQTLPEGLRQAEFDFQQCTFFSWLGVTPYLTQEAIDSTLGFIASRAAGSGVVFDYAMSPSLMSPTQRWVFDAMAQRVAAAGEPWQTFFDPSALAADLKAKGFAQVEDLNADALNARYFRDRADGLQVGSLAHVMSARL
jgi:methyltransferase (TIGR00027 family)